MLTAIATAIGFISSAFPSVLNFWKEKQDNAHDIKLLEMKMESQRIGYQHSVDESEVKAQISEQTALYAHASKDSGVTWVEGLRATVRPIITYCFFILFSIVKLATLVVLIKNGASFFEGLGYIWDDETKTLFAVVISFWFGQRALERHRESSK